MDVAALQGDDVLMKPPRWNTINALLDEALTLPSRQREAFLEARCQDDPEMLEEVRSLLHAEEDAGSFLETPADDYAATLVAQHPDEDPLVGQDVDGYRILDVLGRGGMGIVYKVRNLSLERIEALKVIAPFLVRDAQFLRRFQLEARTLAKIHHAHIVTVYTLRKSRLGHYLTMEYVEGETLGDVIEREGAMEWQQALPIIQQLLTAFEYAHQRGIIHRDIKPRNIMLTPSGTVKVMDFGLAKFYMNQEVTQTAGVSGTLCYMSPEQIRGATLDQRSDLFALGLTIYEMLSGRLPFDRHDSQFGIQRAIVEDRFEALHRFNEALPKRLSAIVMKALEKEPADRYQHAQEMLDALTAFARTVDTATMVLKEPDIAEEEETARIGTALLTRLPWKRVLAGGALASLLVWSSFAFGPSLLDALNDDTPLAIAEPTADTLNPSQEEDPTNQGTFSLETDEQAGLEREADRASNLPELASDQEERTSTATQPGTRGNTGTNSETQSPPAGPETQAQTEATSAASDSDQENTEQNEESPAETEQTLPASQEEAAGTEATTEVESPPEPQPINPAALAVEQSRVLRNPLRDALTQDTWSNVPGPIAAFYQEKLKGLSRKFTVQKVDVVIDDSQVEIDGLQARLPVTVHITVQQKGREGLQSFPIPSTWTWHEQNGQMTLARVE